jgi:hypothetical protein
MRMHPSIIALGLTLSAGAQAQTSLPFPARMLPDQPGDEVLELVQDATLLAELSRLQSVTLVGVPLPVGSMVNLKLKRLGFDPREVGVHVDGLRASYDPGDLSLWEGKVLGAEGSHVYLALSSYGSYGWIHDGVDYTHVSSFAAADNDWSKARMRMYSSRALAKAPGTGGPECQLDSLRGGPLGSGIVDPTTIDPPTYGAATKLECKMAVETDYQLFKLWNNLAAEQTYVMALIGSVSDRYEQQVDVRITYPYVQFYTNVHDPWTSQDTGGGAGDLLNEFQAAWAGQLPAGAHVAHFLSGANLGGGVAWLGVLCNTTYGFAVSGNINGGTSFPVTQGSNTWDFFVMAHETGHNFGTLHTHDGYCPPLDECATNCNGNIQCTNQGTNMSYCHGCNGGMNNITTYFHPTVVGVMRAFAEGSCIPDLGSGTPIVLFADDFESGDLSAGGWKTSNKKAQVVTGAKHEGHYGVRIRNKRWIEKTLDTTGYKNINVSLWRKTKNYDPGEHLRLRWHNGHNWRTLEDATNPGWGALSFDLDHSANNNPHLRLRFRSVASQGNERGDLDEIVVTGEF